MARAPRYRSELGQAAKWRLITLLLGRPREGWPDEVEALALEVHDPDITGAADTARGKASGETRLSLLGPGRVVSPREIAYRGRQDPGHILADGGEKGTLALKQLTDTLRDQSPPPIVPPGSRRTPSPRATGPPLVQGPRRVQASLARQGGSVGGVRHPVTLLRHNRPPV